MITLNFMTSDDKWVVIGIVANGNKCGALGRPGIRSSTKSEYLLIFKYSKNIVIFRYLHISVGFSSVDLQSH